MGPASLSKFRVAVVVPAKKFQCLAGLLWVQRYGPLQVASVVSQAGYYVRLYNEELGTRISPEKIAREYDVVGFSCKTSAITRAEEIAEIIKKEASRTGRKVITVIGGEHISMGGSSRISEHFDYALRGEAEQAFVQLLNKLQSRKGTALMFSLAYSGHNTCESFDNVPDFSLCDEYMETVRGFMFRHFPLMWILKRRMAPLLTFQGSRGCPYNCSFCPTPRQLQSNVYRRRNLASSIECLKEHARISGIRPVMFEDPTAALPFSKESHTFFKNLAGNPAGLRATVLVRADLCKDVELLKIMRSAGVVNLSVGIESISELTLGDFQKKVSYEMIRKAIDIFHQYGFTITGLFIIGYDTDEPDCFEKTRQFIRETGIEKWRATALSQMLEAEDQFMPAHRFFLWNEFSTFGQDVADYCNGEFVLFYPKNMKPSVLQKKLMDFNSSAGSFRDLLKIAIEKRKWDSVSERLQNNIAQKAVIKEIGLSNYFEMIESIEDRFYEEDGKTQLNEELLVLRYKEKKRQELMRMN